MREVGSVVEKLHIREYDPAADYLLLRACFIELQAWERQFEPSMPRPEDAADGYLADMLKRCGASGRRVFVAEEDGVIAGFVCLMARIEPDLDESTEPYAYVSDLVVRAAYRGRGIGRRLMAVAEASARDAHVKRLKVGVLAANKSAFEFYRSGGFREYSVQLVKSL
jgi:ribosomal protein S18 acetylase RimI-like enzyme